jgi:poly-gamma-glutamate synthesis protein (capsule biosynthesis protein)
MVKVLVVAIAVLMFVGVLVKNRSVVTSSPRDAGSISQEKKKEMVTIIATGDVVMGRSVNYQMVKYNNPLWPFEKVKGVLSSGDITVANIEAPFIKDCPTTVEGMVFCGREDAVKGLVASGLDVATLANNHVSDYGVAGIENTVRILRENNIGVAGLEGDILYKTVKGTKFAFLAFNDIYGSIPPVLKADRETIERLVEEARKNADVVVVSMHWGVEYRATPGSRQVELAHLVADAGADLVIGNHPHWVQGDEVYNNTYIKYAHGNLVFDQMWSEETKKGVIGKYTVEDAKLVNKEFIPIYIKDYGQPVVLPN